MTFIQSFRKRWDEILGKSISVEKSVDAIIRCFTKEQMKILDSTYFAGETDSFRDLLLAYNRHKTPSLDIKDYELVAKHEINSLKYLFDQKDNEIEIRQLFCDQFNPLFA